MCIGDFYVNKNVGVGFTHVRSTAILKRKVTDGTITNDLWLQGVIIPSWFGLSLGLITTWFCHLVFRATRPSIADVVFAIYYKKAGPDSCILPVLC